jgi:hypothetical protein
MALDQPTATIIASFVVGIVAGFGWWVAHYFTSKRDVENERRKLRTQYLLEAFRKLETASNRSSESFETDFEKLASAVADIQLLGTLEQVRLAKTFALEFAKNGTASLDELTENLRNELRKELQIEEVRENIVYLRWVKR